MTCQLPRERRIQMEKAALVAWLEEDERKLNAALEPLFAEGNPQDAFYFLLDLAMVTFGRPGGEPVMPVVGRWDVETGQPVRQEMEEVPKGVRIYAQMAAAYLSGDTATAAHLYSTLLADDTPEAFQTALTAALAQAVRRATGMVNENGYPDLANGPGADPGTGYGSLQ